MRESKVAAQMIDLITVHSFIKREVLYPRVCSLLPEVAEEVKGFREEHREAEKVAVQLCTMRRRPSASHRGPSS